MLNPALSAFVQWSGLPWGELLLWNGRTEGRLSPGNRAGGRVPAAWLQGRVLSHGLNHPVYNNSSKVRSIWAAPGILGVFA